MSDFGWPAELLSAGTILFRDPQLLWLLLLPPLLVLLLPRATVGDRVRNFASLLLRVLGLTALIASAARPFVQTELPDMSLVVAVDRSASMSRPRLEDVAAVAERYLQNVPEGVQVQTVNLGSRPTVGEDAPTRDSQDGTDLAQLIDLAAAAAPPARSRRVLLLSDGADTRGGLESQAVLDSAASAGAQDVRIYPLPPAARGVNVGVRSLELPLSVEAGTRTQAVVELSASGRTTATVRLSSDTGELATTEQALEPGRSRLTLGFRAPPAGEHRVRVEVQSPDDVWVEDDRRGGWLVSVADGPILVHGEHAGVVVTALKRFGQRARVQSEFPTRVTPGSVLMVLGPDMEQWPRSRARWIQSAVRDQGLDFILTGGPNGLGVDEDWIAPLDRTLPVVFPKKRKRQPPPLAVVYLIDRSDSMARNRKLDLAVAAVAQSVELLTPEARVGVLAFADDREWAVPLTRARNKDAVVDAVQTLTVGGGTSIYPALREAFQALAGTDALVKHIILLTDGRGVTRYEQHLDLMNAIGRSQVTVSTVALSAESARSELQKVAEAGRGRAYYTETFDDIPQIFIEETMQVLRRNAVDQDDTVRAITGSPLVGEVDWSAAPQLAGHNESKPKGTADLGLVLGDRSRPLLASWRYGLGSATVLATELGGGWGARWVEWSELSPWLGQLIEAIRDRPPQRELSLDLRPRVDGLEVVLVALDVLGSPREQLEPELRIQGDGEATATVLREEAPGRYRGLVPWDGALLVTATVPASAGTPAGVARGQAAPPVAEELAGALLDVDLLDAVAQASSGAVLPQPDVLFREGVRTRTDQRDHWPWLGLLGLFLLILDVGVRRIRRPSFLGEESA